MQKNELPLFDSRRGLLHIFEMRKCRYGLGRVIVDFDSRVLELFDGLVLVASHVVRLRRSTPAALSGGLRARPTHFVRRGERATLPHI